MQFETYSDIDSGVTKSDQMVHVHLGLFAIGPQVSRLNLVGAVQILLLDPNFEVIL